MTGFPKLGPAAEAERAPRRAPEPPFDAVSDASADSFPASDPPAWTGMRVGPPR